MQNKIIFLFFLLFIFSCSNKDDASKNSPKLQDKNIFNEGVKLSKEKNFKKAIEKFKLINDEFPYSEFSSTAKIYNAYLNFELNKLDESILLLTDYINMNPSGKFSDYAHYMLGMCYYVQISEPDRDSDFTIKAMEKFNIVVSKFPESDFSTDAKFKIQFLSNYMAKKEFNIGMFYLKKNVPAAAIKRFTKILKEYEQTTVIPQTLYRISEAFLMLGLTEEAKKSSALLTHNFPDSIWTKQAKIINGQEINEEDKQGFFKGLFNKIF